MRWHIVKHLAQSLCSGSTLRKRRRDKSGFMNVIHPWFGGQMDLCSNSYHPGITCVALGKLLYFSELQFICKMDGC